MWFFTTCKGEKLNRSITVGELTEKFALSLLNSHGNVDRLVSGSFVSYAGLALAGYLEHVQPDRVVLVGDPELGYLSQLKEEVRLERWTSFVNAKDLPCVIVSYANNIPQWALEIADQATTPLLSSQLPAKELMPKLIEFLRHELAPRKTIHGVAMDVYGMGILLTGKSGIGKSECALELVKRGHRLISDDVVTLKKISDRTLLAVCPGNLRHHMELRGVGLIDITALFGIGAISEGKQIDLMLRMEDAVRGKVYERLGLEQKYSKIMDVDIPLLVVPVTEGKNLSIVIEAAAMNQHLRMLGINSARRLTDQLFKRINPSAPSIKL